MRIERNKSMREKVYDILKEMIIDGKIPQGQRIIETEYSQEFQISRTPIREALRMLELEGLVVSNSTGGVIVKKTTKEELIEIYKIRIALEGIILEEVIKKATEKDIKLIEETLTTTKEKLEENNLEEIFALFSQFNIELYEIAKVPRVMGMINNINLYLKRFRRLAIDENIRKLEAFNDHVQILECIKNRDLEEALKINRKHLERSMNFMIPKFEEK
ncbi:MULTISPECIES: GntR family transcriptional regulator [Fusobacterium]|uniref:GntR family transcriptional regulator n=1 Tax=Fusobacterium TaxID=848 RepID=UPI00147699F9|nr:MULTISPECIES: GntR family transcriptional regulator [Fusobacterium]NME36831.1 GntR family transcriptional regulator [Fusobacterium sp. FSA-380-WT-3A]